VKFIFRKVIFYFKSLIKHIIYFIDIITPVKKNNIVFFQSNDKYDDNCKVLFKYLLDQNQFNVHWLYDKKNYDANFVKRYSLKGFWLFLRANIAVISHGTGDFGYYAINRKYVIQTWHGTPIKKIGIYDKKLSTKQINDIYKESYHYDLFIVASEIEKHYISSAIGLNENKFLVSGLPRNDKLSQKNINYNSFIKEVKNKKIILYAPTFRDFGEMIFFPFDDFDIDHLIEFLINEDVYLLLRPHQNDFTSKKLIENFVTKSSGHILLADSVNVNDISDLQPYVDVIITDYSSIYIDLLLNDVPAVFIPYDFDIYEQSRGLAYDYGLVAPGPKVSTQEEFIKALLSALNSASEYKEQRYFVKKMFHKYDDGKACERISKAIEEMI